MSAIACDLSYVFLWPSFDRLLMVATLPVFYHALHGRLEFVKAQCGSWQQSLQKVQCHDANADMAPSMPCLHGPVMILHTHQPTVHGIAAQMKPNQP